MSWQGASEETIEVELAPGPDDPQPLSEEEEKEKATLLEEGFKDWTRRDFNAFVRACEKVSSLPSQARLRLLASSLFLVEAAV